MGSPYPPKYSPPDPQKRSSLPPESYPLIADLWLAGIELDLIIKQIESRYPNTLAIRIAEIRNFYLGLEAKLLSRLLT